MLNQIKLFFALALIAFGVLFSGCAGLQQVLPGSLTLSPGQLQNTLAKGFPLTKNYLGIFDITFSNPQLSMQPDSRRISP